MREVILEEIANFGKSSIVVWFCVTYMPSTDVSSSRPNSQDAVLLDDEGAISEEVCSTHRASRPSLMTSLQFEQCLKHIFAKYCTPPLSSPTDNQTALLSPLEGAYLSSEGLDAWARDTNGEPFSQDTKDEILEFMDVTDKGELTFVSLFSEAHLMSLG